jgi:hypothetical protein
MSGPIAPPPGRLLLPLPVLIAAIGLYCLILAALPGCGAGTDPAAPAAVVPPAAPARAATRWPPLYWWDWGINRVLTAQEQALLAGTGCEALFSLGGAIYQVGNQPLWTPQGRPGEAPSGMAVHLVVRIDSDFARTLDPARTAALVPIVVAGFQRNRTAQTIGLQLDCDVPTRRLGTYIEFLHALRAELPAGTLLSVTMLLDWTHSRELARLAHEVDFLVPQFYTALAPLSSSDTSVTLAGDLSGSVGRLERAGVPYFLGLPTFEQCSVFSAGDRLTRAALPVSPEAAIAAGAMVKRITRGDETTIEMAFGAPVQLAGTALPAGSRLLFGRLSATGLQSTLAALRQLAPKHCLGVCLFHLPGVEATHALSVVQVASAHLGAVRPAAITARLADQGHGRWALVLSNRGDEDWFDLVKPAHVSLQAERSGIRLGERLPHPGLIRATVTYEPSASTGPRIGCAIDIGVLRAGEVVTIEDLRTDPHSRPSGTVWCAGRSYPVE